MADGNACDKDHAGIFEVLLRPGDCLHLTSVPDHLSADPDALSAIARQICPNLTQIQTHIDLETALTAAIWTQPTVFCGSLYLIGHFFSTLRVRARSSFLQTHWRQIATGNFPLPYTLFLHRVRRSNQFSLLVH